MKNPKVLVLVVLVAFGAGFAMPVDVADHLAFHDAGPVATAAATALAQAPEAEDPMLFGPDGLDWQDGPPSLPAGAQFAVLEGVPSEEGPFTMRLRFPAGYEIPAHTHPAIEHVTVLSGTFNVGMGDELDRSDGTALTAGGFVVFPVGHAHYVWIEEETTVQLHGIGPWGIDYVDPADDPRN